MQKQHLAFVANAIDGLLNSTPPSGAPSLNMPFLQHHFAAPRKVSAPEKSDTPEKIAAPLNVSSFMCQSTLFRRAMRECQSHIASSTEDQLSAKLHCLYGVAIDDPCDTRHLATYPFACSKVYDLRNYSEQTVWGPFVDDGWFGVDWERVEAVMVVLAHNLRLVTERTNSHFMPLWTIPFTGASPNSYKALVPPRLTKELTPPPELQDPYNITGTYMRVICFLDYTEFYDYNFVASPPPPGQPRPPLDTDEATRLIIMRIKATEAEAPGEKDGQELPVIHFTGTSHSMHAHRDPNANSRIRGTVRLTKEGEVRWTSFSIYFGYVANLDFGVYHILTLSPLARSDGAPKASRSVESARRAAFSVTGSTSMFPPPIPPRRLVAESVLLTIGTEILACTAPRARRRCGRSATSMMRRRGNLF